MNLLLLNSKFTEYYTYLDEVFKKVPELQEYYWMISELEVNYCENERLCKETVLIYGQELNEIIQKDRIQFVWGVFSGFKNKIEKLPKALPYADGNRNFWKNTPKPQAKGAELEIVCFDSTLTLFINFDEKLCKQIKEIYPDILDLDEYNKKNRS